MPGAYAHLTLAAHASVPEDLERKDLAPQAIAALNRWLKFCDLGAVSPDLPYLGKGDLHASRWADLMHYEQTVERVRVGVDLVKRMTGPSRDKAFAWLLGFASHVVADATIHPVVERRVGPYAQNKTDHRICEMHQDVHIFNSLRMGNVRDADFLDAGIRDCGEPDQPNMLSPVVGDLWTGMLRATSPADEFRDNPPRPAVWHGWFYGVTKAVSEIRMPLIVQSLSRAGAAYPVDPDGSYIKSLRTPEGVSDYNEVFQRALDNVWNAWAEIAADIFDGRSGALSSFDNWNLDTGRNLRAEGYPFWRGEA